MEESEPKQPYVPAPELFTALARADSLRDSYQEIAWEIEGLAQLAGGTDPDDDVCDALAHLACAMKSLTAAREKALAEWAADGGAEPEPDGLESAFQKLGARATGAARRREAADGSL